MNKREIIHRITGFKSCSSCGGISDLELSYDLDGAVRLERYCNKCAESVFEREKDLPEDKEKLAQYYNCERVDTIPHYNPNPYHKH